jgi:hypothetical protein
MSIIKQLGKLDKNLPKSEIEETAIEDVKAVIRQEKYDLLKV